MRLARGLKLWGRKGRVFASRFHAAVLKTLRQIRLATRYVLNNARKHGIALPEDEPDPFSSGPWFRFWKGRLSRPFRADGCPVARPEGGWALIECVYVLLPPIGIDELPRAPFQAGQDSGRRGGAGGNRLEDQTDGRLRPERRRAPPGARRLAARARAAAQR